MNEYEINKKILQNKRKIFHLNSHISLNQEINVKFREYFQLIEELNFKIISLMLVFNCNS